MELTREAYIALLDRTTRGKWHPSQFDQLMAHDTALRARLAACEAERDRERMIAEHNLADTHEAEKRVSDLQHQLAQAEARVQALEAQLDEQTNLHERASWEQAKQLQRLEQENARLRQENEALRQRPARFPL